MAFAVALFAAPSATIAQEASHCDKLADDDAFNKCLAAASPSKAGARPATVPSAGSEQTRANEPRTRSRYSRSGRSYTSSRRTQAGAGRSRAYQSQWRVQRVKGGRVRMTIPMSSRRR